MDNGSFSPTITQDHVKSDELKQLIFAINSAEDGIWEYNILTDTTFVSKRWLEIIGYSEDEYQSSVESWKALLHPDDRERALAVLYSSIAEKVESAHVRYRIRHKNGHWLWIYDRAKILYDEGGNPLIIAGFRTDITQQIQLETHNEELAAIVQYTSVEVYIVDAETLQYVYANNGALKNLGYTLSQLCQCRLQEIVPDIYDDDFLHYLESDTPVMSAISQHRSQNGEMYPVQSSIHKLTYQGKPSIVIFDTDISELTATQNQLLHLATHDSLTGLPNRVLFYDRLSMAIRQYRRKKENIAVLYVDLDRFKQINDSLGHPVGDTLLVNVTQKLKSLLRECDTIARMGGDEFNILLEGVGTTDALIDIVEKLIHAFKEPFIIDGRTLHTTLSIGIAVYPHDGTDAETLLQHADTAMYKAKSDGRNTFCFYADEMGEKAFERIVLENALRIAIKENQFEVYYQPQIDLTNYELIGMEALVRWNHPTWGVVSPATFIPLCEETGLIQEIDFFVLETVVQQQMLWQQQGIKIVKTAVNISAKTLSSRLVAKEVAAIMKFYRCDPRFIAIEITESHIMKNPEEATTILQEFKGYGLEISVDDFGTGYSSLSYLKRLPIDKLKIDQSFIQNIPFDEEDATIAKTIIGLTHNLKLDVIAEGVETIEHENFLLENGCTLAQGYLYAKPLNTSAITVHLSDPFAFAARI